MSFIEQDSRNKIPSSAGGTQDANYFAFFDKPTPENLAANHGGILTPQQQKALERIIANQKLNILILGGMLVCAAFIMGFLFWKVDVLDGVISFNAQLINAAVIILVFGLFAVLFTGDWFVFFTGDDLANGVVESAVGRIEWSGKRYRMRTDSRLLRSLPSTVALPPPGDYRFYYLPFTRLVVMAEELRTGQANDRTAALLDALASSHNFSPDDLRENQKGLLSKRQENQLLGILVPYGMIFVSGLILFGSMIVQILRAVSTTYFILLLVIGAFLVLRFGWATTRIVQDLWRGEVRQIEGLVSRQTRRSRYHLSYYYLAGTHKFEVTSAAYHALLESPTYRIYYVPHSERLVSIEPLQTQKDANNDLPDHST